MNTLDITIEFICVIYLKCYTRNISTQQVGAYPRPNMQWSLCDSWIYELANYCKPIKLQPECASFLRIANISKSFGIGIAASVAEQYSLSTAAARADSTQPAERCYEKQQGHKWFSRFREICQMYFMKLVPSSDITLTKSTSYLQIVITAHCWM